MRSPTVPLAKPTWRVASMSARRRYPGWRDELRLAVSSVKGAHFHTASAHAFQRTATDGRRPAER